MRREHKKTQNKLKRLKPIFVRLLRPGPGNRADPFSKEKVSKEVDLVMKNK